jgi:flagellar biosynthesis protein FliQ
VIDILKTIVQEAATRLHHQVTTYLPSLLAAAVMVIGAYLTAILVRWLIYKIFKGFAVDKFLRESGVVYILAPSGRLQATRIVAETVFWCILLTGFLLGLDVFGSDFTTQLEQGIVSFLPKLFVAGVILLGGSWLGQYLGRATLVWAVNENLSTPRRLATGVRVLVNFGAVVIAADQLHFSSNVFLAAFIIIVGGLALAASLAIGLGNRGMRHLFGDHESHSENSTERSIWSHL